MLLLVKAAELDRKPEREALVQFRGGMRCLDLACSVPESSLVSRRGITSPVASECASVRWYQVRLPHVVKDSSAVLG